MPLIISSSFFQLQAQNKIIEINVPNEFSQLEADNSYTIVFELTNKTNQEINIHANLLAPNSFKVFQSQKIINLKALSKKTIMFPFKVDRQCLANSYKATLTLSQNNEVILEKILTLEVMKLHNIEIEVLKSPEYLILEDSFFCEYLVTNYGNSEEKIKFESFNSQKIIPASASLKPDSTLVVKVFQKTPKTNQKTLVLNTLKAKLTSTDSVFSNQSTIDVFPNTNKKPDLYHRFPIILSSTYNTLKGIDTINAIKYQIEGNGYIDSKNKHFVGFDYSGPSKSEFARFGEYEKYNLQYRTSNFEANFGDVNFSMSNITESSRYGKGGIMYFKLGKLATSLFYIEPRFTNQIKESYGGKFDYLITDKSAIQVGFIQRKLNENQEIFNSSIYNVATNYVGTSFRINSELALENNYKSYGFGYSLESSLNLNKIILDASWQFSDKNYLGYLRNSNQLMSSLQYKISDKIKLSTQLYQSSINPVKDTINYNSSPIINLHQTQFDFQINSKNNLKIGGVINSSEDRFLPKKFDYEEKLISLSYSFKIPYAHNFIIYNRYGTSVNNISADLSPKKVFYSSAQYSIYFTSMFEAGLTGDYQLTNKESIENNIISSFYYGGFVRFNYKNKLDLNLFYKSDYSTDEMAEQKSFLEGRLNYNFYKQHHISISASQSSTPITPNRKDLMMAATYKLTINTPLWKDKTVGSFIGKITSSEPVNLGGIIFQLGDQIAITNQKGEFHFYKIIPNAYYLSVKQSSLPKGKIIIEQLPLLIDIIPNHEITLNFTIGNTGSLSGNILFEQLDDLQSKQFVKKIPNLVIKISKDDKVFLTKSDDLGNFEFKELIPGNWKVELLVNNLKQDFTFEVVENIVTIESNKNNSVTFKVSSKKRDVIKSKKKFDL